MLTTAECLRYEIEVVGIVQGVGFRPFIYDLAKKYGVTGFVQNTQSGVTLEAQGSKKALHHFLQALKQHPPPLAKIHSVDMKMEKTGIQGEHTFSIQKSDPSSSDTTDITPDANVCPDCLEELFDPENKRYEYPFINCTNCGPRYSIILKTPYDRANTSMKPFPMCAECLAEYKNPTQRRFHAQPNACPKCGPRLTLSNEDGTDTMTRKPIRRLIDRLKQGAIAVVKGVGGYHLVCDGTNENAVQALRQRKFRKEKPFALMAPSLSAIKELAHLSAKEEDILLSRERPIVLVRKKKNHTLAKMVAPGTQFYGFMLPYTPLQYLLFAYGLQINAKNFQQKENNGKPPPFHFKALIMTSANISDEPIVYTEKEVFSRLSGIADLFLTHNREIVWRCDDSIVRVLEPTDGMQPHKDLQLTRVSRGFIPAPIFLKQKGPSILACGGDLKNVFCLFKNRGAYPGPHSGDLYNSEAYRSFTHSIAHYKKVFRIEPTLIAVDMHPGYRSTMYGKNQNLPCMEVQHHHAHIASVLAEHGLSGDVIGICMDGTGLGEDGKIRGSEIGITSARSFIRKSCFKPLVLPGGDSAAKEPWRTATGLLFQMNGEGLFEKNKGFVQSVGKKRIEGIIQMIKAGVNCPLSSGAGRLFDAVASLLGVQHENSFEGQAPILLESFADFNDESEYEYEIDPNGKIDFTNMIHQILLDLENRVTLATLSAAFHNTIAAAVTNRALTIKKETGLDRVCLSGGVFQNQFLLRKLITRLTKHDCSVYTPNRIPTNDGGLALGQILVVCSRI